MLQKKQRQKKELEFYTWADKVAAELRKRAVKRHVVHGMWTPSGFFHIGNARPELFTPAIAYQAALDAGLQAEFNFFFDDFDDFDKIPEGINIDKKKFSEYLGLPLTEVPSPSPQHKNWAEYFEEQILVVAEKFGVKPKWHSVHACYKQGRYDKAIKIVLENSDLALKIWKEIAGKQPKGLPVMPRCENCGKALTTLATKYDGKFVYYSCTEEVKGIRGCGHSGKVKPEKGAVKLPWRLHWPATWFTFGTTFESGGRDHFTPGGSVYTGKAFAEKIFKIQSPILIGTEFVLIEGKKMRGSEGNLISMNDWVYFAEPELLRFLYVASSPQKMINLDLLSNKFFLLADRYDKAERIYFNFATERDKQDGEKKIEQMKRQYKLSQIKAQKVSSQISYSDAVLVAQIRDLQKEAEVIEILNDIGIKVGDNKENKEKIFNRLRLAKNWLEKYAPADVKLKVTEKVSAEIKKVIGKKEKEAIKELATILKEKISGEALQAKIYEIAREHAIEPKAFFQILYRIIINKEQGPRLGPFILAIGKEKVQKLLSQI